MPDVHPSAPGPSLARRLRTRDAVAVGLGSMLGAGVFAAYGPAAAAAGPGLLLSLLLAGLVALCGATASAQLAARYPTSGGTYVYARERLGHWPGFVAGWGFVVGKTSSLAAMALTVGAYAAPGRERPVALLAVAVAVALGYRGVTRTAAAARVLVVVVLLCLGVAVAAALTGPRTAVAVPWAGVPGGGWYGTLQAAGLLFFAFAGFARVATMGEEVRDPARTVPRAVLLSLGAATLVYAVVGLVLLATLGVAGTAASSAPLADAVAAGRWPWAGAVVRVGAVAASAGALLALLAGVSRTTLAMAREGDLPRWLAGVHPVHRVPHRAELVVGAVVLLVVAVGDVRGAIGFSSAGVLVYYLLANLSALGQPAAERRFPRLLQVVGVLACTALVLTLPPGSVAAGAAVLLVGVAYRLLRLRREARRAATGRA